MSDGKEIEYEGGDEHGGTEAVETRRWSHELWDITKVILISLAIVLPIRYYIAQPFIVRGASMEPTFEDREYLIIDEISFSVREPERGEVVVFHYPRDPRQFFIKRVIGLPGETVTLSEGKVYIKKAGEDAPMRLDEPYLPPKRVTRPDMEATLAAGEYFVVGDNRDFSFDSRTWGPVDRELLVGRAFLRAWPLTRAGLVTD